MGLGLGLSRDQEQGEIDYGAMDMSMLSRMRALFKGKLQITIAERLYILTAAVPEIESDGKRLFN